MNKTRILIVEDEIVVAEDIQQRLLHLGYEVVGVADTAAEAVRLAAATRPDMTLMDIMLHGLPEGIQAAEHLRRELDLPVIYLTAHNDPLTLLGANLTDPYGYIVKPFDERRLQVTIELAPHRHEMERKVRHIADWLGATLSSIGDAVIATDIKTEIRFLNAAAEKLTGWSLKDASGKPCREVLRLVDDKTRQPLDDLAASALRHGMVIRLAPNTLLITRSGEEIHVGDSASRIYDEAGEALGVVVVLADATDLAATRNRVQALNNQVKALQTEKEQLESRSGDLEAFAAAVSHDLRAPLRAIEGFSGVLAESSRNRLDSAGRQFLDRIRTSARQIDRMVEDYHAFLKLPREQPPRLWPVDVKSLAETVFAELSSVPDQKPARFICGSLPQALADAAMLRQVLAKLIGNALKYSSQRERPVVEVGGTAGDSFHTFFVRDNGEGLDLTRAAKIFEPFQRFHSSSDFSGAGLGLAIVKRILERHGARIWVESQPGAGATFFFTLPAKPAAASQSNHDAISKPVSTRNS